MRNDAGINGDAQRIEQMVWILFLKVYNAKEVLSLKRVRRIRIAKESNRRKRKKLPRRFTAVYTI
jgi:hypothetical protein